MIELAGGPVSWGVDFADAPGNPPYTVVLDALAAVGLRWMELGPVGYLPGDALASRGLGAVGTFVFDDFHAGAPSDEVLAATDAALDAITATGGSLLVLIDRPSAARAAVAGRSPAAPRLDDVAWTSMLELFVAAADRAAARGVRAVVHPHAGGYLEFEDEISRLLADTSLDLCLDTGHALYAGSDPLELLHRHADRIRHLHLKDVAAPVRARGLGFWDAVAAGIFCPVGEGLLDLPGLRDTLSATGYSGFATIEQDRRPDTAGDPATDLARSVTRLRELGIG
ncbi:sugar phosphate isomerase/epimerase family protein [Solirubrobacter soli]|uniref:sugar phosphate isomerase/epimerase family protein n=1 Tax=Solirubrobacter soli TaxID=363832 RepID=UPI00069DFBAD|nr:sugar phosphate isomerase/epimerase [Solirubrobacter soli]